VLRTVCLALLLSTAAATAAGSPVEFRRDDIVVMRPWTRATPRAATVGAGYFRVENRGGEADRLVGGHVEVASRFEIHETVVANEVMSMRRLAEGIEVPPASGIEVMPGGIHAMLVGLQKPLVAGDRIRGTLRFQRAGDIAVDFVVVGFGAPAPGPAAE
jgi:periplasmic copper chaperone A